MSIPFNDTSVAKSGLLQVVERRLGFEYGHITNDADLLSSFTAEVNLTLDKVFGFMFPLGGTWQLDDSNHTKYPFISTNLVSGQRDYKFLLDEQGNTVLDIYRVMIADTSGVFREIKPVDIESPNTTVLNTDSFISGINTTGIPTRYDKTGNSIFLDLIPNYNYSKGLRVFINREASYFTVNDTTKKVGFASLFHEYFALLPAYKYASTFSMPQAGGRLRNGAFTGLLYEVTTLEDAIKTYFSKREKDVRTVMRGKKIKYI